MAKNTLIILLIALMLVPALPSEADSGVVVGALALLGSWLFGYVMTKVVDRALLNTSLSATEQDIERDRLMVRKGRIVDESMTPKEKRQMLWALDDAKRVVADIKDYIRDNPMTDSELLSYCSTMVVDRIKPLQIKLAEAKGRMLRISTRLDTLAQTVESVDKYGRTTRRHVVAANKALAELDTEVEILQENDARIDAEIVGLKNSYASLSGEVYELKLADKRFLDSLRLFKDEFRNRPVIGAHYQAFKFTSIGWNDRYASLPFEISSIKTSHSGGLSVGYWFRKFLYVEGSFHYLPQIRQTIDSKESASTYEFQMEGFGWSGVGLFTLQLNSMFMFDIGLGITRNAYTIRVKTIDRETSLESGVELLHRRTEDLMSVTGFRIGKGSFYGIARLEAVWINGKVRGLYGRLGFQTIL